MTREQSKKIIKTVVRNEYKKLFIRYHLFNKEYDKLFGLVELFSSKYEKVMNEVKALNWYKEKCLDYKGLFGWIVIEKINWKLVRLINIANKYHAMFTEYVDRCRKMVVNIKKEFNSASEISDSKEYNDKLYNVVMMKIDMCEGDPR